VHPRLVVVQTGSNGTSGNAAIVTINLDVTFLNMSDHLGRLNLPDYADFRNTSPCPAAATA
jgi:hypothetical protein